MEVSVSDLEELVRVKEQIKGMSISHGWIWKD